jgi:hypothetical protein
MADILDSGVDWISASAPVGPQGTDLRVFMDGIVADEESTGNEHNVFEWRGYRGYRAGRASIAENDDYVICSLASSLAHRWHGSIATLATNVSRLDLQVTVMANQSSDMDYAKQAWDALGQAGIRQQARRGYTLIENSRGGSTLYCGSRRSDAYLRLYDKSAKSPEYEEGTWRFEVELKHRRAEEAWKVARDLGYSPSLTAGTVYEWFARVGLASPFLPIEASRLVDYAGSQRTWSGNFAGYEPKSDLQSAGSENEDLPY